jgi:uncharacterized membrane-anchored protein
MIRALVSLALVQCFSLSTALAHPGHGDTDPNGWRHHLTEPVHVAAVAVALVALVVVVRRWTVRRKRLMLQGCGSSTSVPRSGS